MTHRISKILVSIDLGPQSYYIVQKAQIFANALGGDVWLLHALERPVMDFANLSEQQTHFEKQKANALSSLEKLANCCRIPLSHIVLERGLAQDRVLDYIKIQSVDCVVVGSHGIGGYAHLLGSTTQYLVSHITVPILVIPVQALASKIQKTMKNDFPWEQSQVMDYIHEQSATHYGSKQGFGEEVKRGPRLVKRPPGAPYRGGTRRDEDENDDH